MALQPLFIVADYHYAVIYTPDFLPLDHKSKADTSPLTGCGIYSRLFWGELWKWRTDVCVLTDMMDMEGLLFVHSPKCNGPVQ